MIDYAHQRAGEALKSARKAVLATNGPTGVQVSEFPCEAKDLKLYLLLPQTSDHLFNLEQDSRVALLTKELELRGRARALSPEEAAPELEILRAKDIEWDVLIEVKPIQIQIRRHVGWGADETIDLVASA